MTTNEQLTEQLVAMVDKFMAEHNITGGINAIDLVDDIVNDALGEYVTTDTSLYRQLMNEATDLIVEAYPAASSLLERANVVSRLHDDMCDIADNAND